MAERVPGSGRQKGTPNRNTEALQDKCKQLGVDPLDVLLMFAKGDWAALGYASEDVISAELRQKSAADAAKYIHAQRKAVEHNIPPEVAEQLKMLEGLTPDQLKAIASGNEQS